MEWNSSSIFISVWNLQTIDILKYLLRIWYLNIPGINKKNLITYKIWYFNHTLLVSKLFVCKKPACYCHNAVTIYKYPHVEFEVSVICVYSQREMFTFGAWNTRDLYVKEAKQKLIHKGEFWGVSNYAPTNSSSM